MKTLKVALAVLAIAFVGAGCSAEPAPTPEIIVKTIEIPGPQPTPTIVEKTVTVYVVPQACLDALEINADAWTLNSQFMGWLVDEDTWTDSDQKKFSNLTDRFVAARDECWDAADGSAQPSS